MKPWEVLILPVQHSVIDVYSNPNSLDAVLAFSHSLIKLPSKSYCKVILPLLFLYGLL